MMICVQSALTGATGEVRCSSRSILRALIVYIYNISRGVVASIVTNGDTKTKTFLQDKKLEISCG